MRARATRVPAATHYTTLPTTAVGRGVRCLLPCRRVPLVVVVCGWFLFYRPRGSRPIIGWCSRAGWGKLLLLAVTSCLRAVGRCWVVLGVLPGWWTLASAGPLPGRNGPGLRRGDHGLPLKVRGFAQVRGPTTSRELRLRQAAHPTGCALHPRTTPPLRYDPTACKGNATTYLCTARTTVAL